MKTQAEGSRGIAIVCGLEGEIQEVLRDDFGLFQPATRFSTLVDLVDPSEARKIANCLEALRTKGWVMDWEINLPHPPEFITLKFSGLRKDQRLLLVASRSRNELTGFLDDLPLMSHELVTALRVALHKEFEIDQNRAELESQHFDELSRLNNELVTLQRQLAQKNAQLYASNERFRSLVENSYLGILIVDQDYRFTYVNDRLCQILGIPYEEIIDQDFRKFLDPETAERLAGIYRAHQRGAPVQDSYEFEIIRPDGQVRHVEIRTDLIQDLDGKPRTMGQLLDITERKRAEKHLKEAAALAEQQRLARELHDSITQSLFLAASLAETLPRVWKNNPEGAQQAISDLRRLTRGALAEMRSTLLELRPADLTRQRLNVLLRQLTDGTLARTKIEVLTTLEGDCALPDEVQIALYRIAQEALSNTVKHSQAKRAFVSCWCEPEQIKLSIRDDGIGFDPNRIEAGCLGLDIMRERARTIGAEFVLESEAGQGTEVTVTWLDGSGTNKP